ncbi:hypothetical protein BU24DRAFT_155513 [Aaosphaeria arxii CBS 175.79]|uniref:Uncharacterized protein n=1 Tax=Aaosphaeria arxii CBS 175.79 TaxID=1450172 RepID=A0A6A5XXW7_9PLEO|nr:uncharacterized protein BU24DRAFT_155513 [Aaosphaeria arxii CBS 175.79]KAF2017667.1 hypothetical protein BU24DRAFT_155513 [Aaosphaeria arxii CBS 175.79]
MTNMSVWLRNHHEIMPCVLAAGLRPRPWWVGLRIGHAMPCHPPPITLTTTTNPLHKVNVFSHTAEKHRTNQPIDTVLRTYSAGTIAAVCSVHNAGETSCVRPPGSGHPLVQQTTACSVRSRRHCHLQRQKHAPACPPTLLEPSDLSFFFSKIDGNNQYAMEPTTGWGIQQGEERTDFLWLAMYIRTYMLRTVVTYTVHASTVPGVVRLKKDIGLRLLAICMYVLLSAPAGGWGYLALADQKAPARLPLPRSQSLRMQPGRDACSFGLCVGRRRKKKVALWVVQMGAANPQCIFLASGC